MTAPESEWLAWTRDGPPVGLDYREWCRAWEETIEDPGRAEQEYLAELRATANGAPWSTDIAVEDVALHGTYPDSEVRFVYTVPWRPGCRFGFRWPLWDAPECWMTSILMATLYECVFAAPGLPRDCAEDSITWVR